MSVATPLRPFGRKEPPASLPNSKFIYEPSLKRELAHRLILICSVFFGFTWLFSFISTLDITKGPPLGVLGHLVATSLTALFALMIGAVPSLVIRGRAVSEKYTPLPTRAATFRALISNTRTWRTLACFAGSGFSLSILHVAFLNLSEWEDTRLSILSPTRRNPFRLNERFFYLAFFNSSLGLVFAFRDVIRQRWIVRWPYFDDYPIITTPTSVVLQSIFAVLNMKAIISTTFITLMHVFLFPVWYRLLRLPALPILRNLPWLSGLTRPFLHAFGKTWIVDVPWFRLLALGFKTSLGWELVESAFDDWVTQPIAVSHKSPNPDQALVAGLHSQDPYFKHHAYLELFAVARSESPVASARRTALFADTKTSPTLWNAVIRELLITLGRNHQCLLRRGRPPPPLPPAQPPAPMPRTPKTPKTPLIRQAILRPSPPLLFDSLASDGAVTQALTSIATLPESVGVPDVFLPSTPFTPRSVKEAVNKVETKTTEVVKKVESKVTLLSPAAIMSGVLAWAGRKLPQEWRLREWWTEVRFEKHARACIPEGVLDAVCIDTLSHLVAASLKDDTLGTVQRDLPRILEALLSFLAEVEAFHAELESKLPRVVGAAGQQDGARLKGVESARDVARAMEVVVPVLNALRAGVGLIVKTFGDRLCVYKFPPVTAKRLQSFMDCL